MAQSETGFFREIVALASAGHMASLVHLVGQRRDWLAERAPTANPGDPYGRLPLHRDRRGEVMLAGWETAQQCAPHDHGDARGLVIVVAGAFTETRYRHVDGGLHASGRSTAMVGSALPVSHGLIHDMRCDAAGATLHVYLPSIDRMRVYDVATRSTWIVDDHAGAWIPRDTRHVISTEAWPRVTGAVTH